jgi:hypothetical protein
MLANSPSSSAFASTKKSDSIPLSGFSYIYQQYLDSVSGDDTDAEATLLSTPISIPENAAIKRAIVNGKDTEGKETYTPATYTFSADKFYNRNH